jgi:CheY-like chemotaxis protein
MDMQMPVMDGLEATPKIIELGTGTPIVAMTANIMSGDKEIYKSIGLKDYVGKPFSAQELWRCLLKYLQPADPDASVPADLKSGASNVPENIPSSSAGQSADETLRQLEDSGLMAKLKVVFLNDNREKFKEITDAVSAGDIKLAYRLAHTLKSNAGQLGKTALQTAAADVEAHLKDGKNLTTEEQMNTLAAELDAVLEELAPLVEPATDSQAEAAAEPFDIEKARELLDALEPMLISGNPECLSLVDRLRAIPESGELIRQIEDFDFEPAVSTFNELKNKMGG